MIISASLPDVTGDRMVWAVVACGAIVLAAEPPTIALLRRRGMLDVPGGRPSHSVPTPRGGGAPIAIGLLFVNVFNFMDGVNGISGAHAVIGGVMYACLADWRRDALGVAAGLALVVGAAAFLPWNAVRARVFLGDVGSPGLFTRAGLGGADRLGRVTGARGVAGLVGAMEAMSEMEEV